jgi:hypothetical protein
MYVGKRYEASVATSDRERFRCVYCGFECEADVFAHGTGTGLSPYMLDNAGAAQGARDAAQRDATLNAHTALAGAECLKCGKRNRRVVGRLFTISLVIGLVMGVACGGIVLVAAKGESYGWYLGELIAAAIALGYAIKRTMRLLTGAVLHPPR